MPEQERQKQGANMRAVHVCIGHDYDSAVAALAGVELFFSDAAPDGRDQLGDLIVGKHLIDARLFYIEDLALKRQNGLCERLPTLLGDPPGRIPLDQIEFGRVRVLASTVPQLAGQARTAKCALA